MIYVKIMIFLISALLFFNNCASMKKQISKPYPIEEYYYDLNNYSLLRLFQTNEPDILNSYNSWIKNNPYSSYEFYEKMILKLSASEFDSTREFDHDKVIQKPKLLSRPAPDFPDTKEMVGSYLKIFVTVVIDTMGNSEFVELFNLYRTKDSTNDTDCEYDPGWRCTEIYNVDKPYIKSAIFAAQKIKFQPLIYEKEKRKTKINIPYVFTLK